MDIWSIIIIGLVAIFAWKMFSSSKEGYMVTSTRPPSSSSCASQSATIPSYSSLQTQAEAQLTNALNEQKTQTLSPKDLLPPTVSTCGTQNDLPTDLANYSAAIGVARVGLVSSNVPKRYFNLDLRGSEKIATCQNISPWNMPAVTPEDIPVNKPLC
jgi:hypothetical protein